MTKHGSHSNRLKTFCIIGGLTAGFFLAEALVRTFQLALPPHIEASDKYRYNNLGLRGPDVDVEQLKKGHLILVVGDSFTFGQGIALRDTFSARLQMELDNETPNTYTVLNAGLPGRNASQEYHYLMQEGFRLDPEMIILQATLNDAEMESYTYAPLTAWPDFEKRYLWKSHLFFYFVLAYNIEKLPYPAYIQSLYKKSAPGYNYFHFAWEGIAVEARKRKIPVLLVLFPFFENMRKYPYANIHTHLKSFAEGHGYTVLDLLPAYQKSPLPATAFHLHPNDSHPNEHAHALAAQAILPVLRQSLKSLPPKR